MRLRVVLCIGAGGLVVACGLGVVGAGPSDGGLDEDAGPGPVPTSPTSDGAVPPDDASAPEAGACTTKDTTCSGALAAGWTPIAFSTSQSAACPAGYTSTDLVTNPVAAAGACQCGCAIATNNPPSCAKGTFAPQVGSTSACSNTGSTFVVNGTGCTALANPGPLNTYGRYPKLPLTPGTCNPSVQKDASKVSGAALRACAPPPACAEDVCLGTGLGALASCIVHDGDVACPAGPFAAKTLAGTGVTITCGGCATCTNAATCGPATIRVYNDAACASEVGSRPANDTCVATTGMVGATTSYFRYDVATMNASCTPANDATTALALDATRTICCR